MAQLLLFMFLLSPVLARDLYSLADLEVLVQEEGYREFFAHALDIRPSQRQDAWRGMVAKMAEGFSNRVLQKSEIDRQDFQKIEEIYSWPSLKSNDVFKLRRREIGLKYLKSCLKGSPPCWKEIKSFWEQDKLDAETAYRLAELTTGLEGSPLPTWNFLEISLKSPLSEFYCQKDFVMKALWGKLEMDYVKLGPQGDLLQKIDQTLHPDCLPLLNAESVKRLYSPEKTNDRELSFQILKSQKKADQTTMDFFFTVYLLDNPSRGELFNYSWNRVRELGGASERREEVLKKLKTLDPVPDAILASLDQSKKRVILKHFKMYFPEYLDFYANQCVKFFSGQGLFPDGNPTVNCQEFMNSELAPEIIDDFQLKKYHAVRKI
jgi:hypothetical protein